MILPYSHKAALAQAPVPFQINDRTILLYPIRQGDAIQFDVWLQYQYAKQYGGQVNLLPPQERKAFIARILDEAEKFDQYSGYRFIISNVDAMVRYVQILTRFEWDEQDIRVTLFPDNEITDGTIATVDMMRTAVSRPIPPEPPQPNVNRKRREYSDEESVVRIYRSIAEKYHWTYQQCLDLTPYQVFWYLYLMPEERELMEDMERMSKSKTDIPHAFEPNVRRFNSPEEYEEWLAQQNATR